MNKQNWDDKNKQKNPADQQQPAPRDASAKKDESKREDVTPMGERQRGSLNPTDEKDETMMQDEGVGRDDSRNPQRNADRDIHRNARV